MAKALRILGIDPGLNHTGYGIVDYVPGRFTYVASGVVEPAASDPLSRRLGAIFSELGALIDKHAPAVSAIEKTFLNTNAQSSMLLSHARGAAMVAAASRHLECCEFSTREIKKSVTGYGAASKEQIKGMVGRHLRMEGAPLSFDEADALAVAICYGNSQIMLSLVPAAASKSGSSGTAVARKGSSSGRSRSQWTQKFAPSCSKD